MAYRPRTLTGRIALALGVPKKAVRESIFVVASCLVMITLLLAMLTRD